MTSRDLSRFTLQSEKAEEKSIGKAKSSFSINSDKSTKNARYWMTTRGLIWMAIIIISILMAVSFGYFIYIEGVMKELKKQKSGFLPKQQLYISAII